METIDFGTKRFFMSTAFLVMLSSFSTFQVGNAAFSCTNLQRHANAHLSFLRQTQSTSPSFRSTRRLNLLSPPSQQRRPKMHTNTPLNAVSKKDSYEITVLSGDGIGPEITKATLEVLNALQEKCGFAMNFTPALIGGAALDAVSNPFPEETLHQIQTTADSVLLACIGGYKWDSNPRELRPETGLLAMRKSLKLFANLRPAKVMPQLVAASTLKPEIVSGVDIMVVRELTGDVYFGTPKGIETRSDGKRVGFNNMIYAEDEIERIARVAADVCLKRSRGNKLCSIDKANVLDVSALWREVVSNVVNNEYPDRIELSHMYIDNAAMQLIRYPKQFDTIVCGNIFGDILSDEASMLVGSLGMLPSASLGDGTGPGVFEPCHGSAPDIAGQDKANPLAMILSAAMMLQYDLDRYEEAKMLERAVEQTLNLGLRTGDIKIEGDNCRLVGCHEMGQAVAQQVRNMNDPNSIDGSADDPVTMTLLD